jgi:membrane protease YdiL (CAAX protease family)
MTVHRIFFGPEGLRALWGIVLFRSAYIALRFCILPVALAPFPASVLNAQDMLPSVAYVSEGAVLLSVFLATLLMARIEGRTFTNYGFGARCSLGHFAAGLGWGAAALALLVGILRAAGLLVFDGRLLFGAGALRYGVLWLGGFLLVGVTEEMLARGYMQFTLTRGCAAIYGRLFGARRPELLGFWTAALILSIAFSYNHLENSGESPLGLLSAGLIGMVFCLSLARTGSLWWAIGFHASWDWAQSFLFGVADSGTLVQGRLFDTHPVGRAILSGGLTGPEGSVLVLPILGVIVGVVVITLPRTNSKSRFGDPVADARDAPLH